MWVQGSFGCCAFWELQKQQLEGVCDAKGVQCRVAWLACPLPSATLPAAASPAAAYLLLFHLVRHCLQVVLARHKATGKEYALKVVDKQYIIR